ncbi:MAG: hypothetical protein V4484_02180 [Pseudomonadota bacterium]
MKKSAPFLILFILALLICNALFDGHGMSFDIDGEDFDGPLGAIAAFLMASGGILIGIVVAALVAVILVLVFAGVGVVIVCALVLAALVVVLAVSPLMLPLLIPVAIIWALSRRNRQRPIDAKAQPA